ncbi:hypothetical protein [uncultured Williamsia sp.]|uniref:hypothetical protein n=1 Tax=uncultured Williamsia sp. TaxID=259311 RepID=UPI0026329C85|nr:hypothetical protein [uncultured Williamsia sp.]
MQTRSRTARIALGLAVAAMFALVLGACSADPPSSDLVPSSSASASSSAPSATSSPPPPPSIATTTPAAVAPETTVEQTAEASCTPPPGIRPDWDKDCDGQIDADAPVGDVGCDTTECLLDQYGQGAKQGSPATQCAAGEVRNDGGGTYSTCVNGQWNHIEPTFDPNSGDGYGPNQPLPPLCVRFPDQYTC